MDNDVFMGVIYPPDTDPFDKLFEEIDVKKNKFIFLVTRSGRKIKAMTSRIMVDGLDQELNL